MLESTEYALENRGADVCTECAERKVGQEGIEQCPQEVSRERTGVAKKKGSHGVWSEAVWEDEV